MNRFIRRVFDMFEFFFFIDEKSRTYALYPNNVLSYFLKQRGKKIQDKQQRE